MTVRGDRHGNVASFFFCLFRSLAASCNQQQTGESGKHLTHLSSSCFSWRLIALDRPPHRSFSRLDMFERVFFGTLVK